MKKNFLKVLGLGIVLSFSLNGTAQCLNENGDFESFTGPVVSSPSGPANTWINDNVDNWSVSHGSPSFQGSPTRNMWMWSYSGIGEGIFTDYTFVAGETYELCYDVWRDGTSNTDSEVRVELTTGLAPNYASGAGGTPPTPATSQALTTQPWVATGTWVTITETFTAGATFDQLWIYPFLAGSPTPNQAACRIDNVCIKSVVVDPCGFEPQFKHSEGKCTSTFTNTTVIPAGLTVLNVSWDLGDGSSATGDIVSHYYTTSGYYLVCMTVWAINEDGECCQLDYCTEVFVKGCDPCESMEFAKIAVTGSNPFTFSISGMTSSIYDLLGYHWDFGDGNTATGQSVNHTYASGGIYEVCLTVYYFNEKEKACCSVRICTEVEAKDVAFEKGARGSGLEEGVNYETETPFIDSQKINAEISPNPSNGEVMISLKEGTINSVHVYDPAGNLIHSDATIDNQAVVALNMQNLEAGVYLVVINQGDEMNKTFNKMVIK